MKRLKMPKRTSKMLLFYVLIGIFALSIGGYVWWSVASWSAYEQKYTEKQHSIQHNLESVWNMPADTVEQKQAKLAQLASASTEIAKVDPETCNQTLFIEWQRVIQANSERARACKDMVQSVQNFSASLRPAVEFLQQGEAMAKIMAHAPSKTEVAEADFSGQLSAWRTTLDAVNNISTGNEFGAVKQAARGSTEGVIKAWEEIIAAHEAKDKARYTKAVQALAAAYDRLEAITKIHTEQLNVLVATFK